MPPERVSVRFACVPSSTEMPAVANFTTPPTSLSWIVSGAVLVPITAPVALARKRFTVRLPCTTPSGFVATSKILLDTPDENVSVPEPSTV